MRPSTPLPGVARQGPPAAGVGGYRFGWVEPTEGMEWIHRLNHDTFVRELPQHTDPGTGALVDKHHLKNTYYAAWRGDDPVGMVAVNATPPFSVAEKVPPGCDLEALGPSPLEVRLLAVALEHRRTAVVVGLGCEVLAHARRHGHSHLLISAAATRLAMYRQMGFRPLGPPVLRGAVSFVPMAVSVAGMSPATLAAAKRFGRRSSRAAQ